MIWLHLHSNPTIMSEIKSSSPQQGWASGDGDDMTDTDVPTVSRWRRLDGSMARTGEPFRSSWMWLAFVALIAR